jgi:hypothetical protein
VGIVNDVTYKHAKSLCKILCIMGYIKTGAKSGKKVARVNTNKEEKCAAIKQLVIYVFINRTARCAASSN